MPHLGQCLHLVGRIRLVQRISANAVRPAPVRREAGLTGRNDPCPCGSGNKFKKCCLH
ncbi:SEC-C domain-containing protein [Morganella morganii]|nr:SEC-C domain-containing protein [Morganella morganii]EMD0831038.1 SEC-C domain-containing protein [Morganella morganii]